MSVRTCRVNGKNSFSVRHLKVLNQLWVNILRHLSLGFGPIYPLDFFRSRLKFFFTQVDDLHEIILKLVFILGYPVLHDVIFVLNVVGEECAELVLIFTTEVLGFGLEPPEPELILLVVILGKLVVYLTERHVQAFLLQTDVLAFGRKVDELQTDHVLRVQEHSIFNLNLRGAYCLLKVFLDLGHLILEIDLRVPFLSVFKVTCFMYNRGLHIDIWVNSGDLL